jgi:hypothetical protein
MSDMNLSKTEILALIKSTSWQHFASNEKVLPSTFRQLPLKSKDIVLQSKFSPFSLKIDDIVLPPQFSPVPLKTDDIVLPSQFSAIWQKNTKMFTVTVFVNFGLKYFVPIILAGEGEGRAHKNGRFVKTLHSIEDSFKETRLHKRN